MQVELLNERCDRCGKVQEVLRPFTMSEQITYRGKTIKYPYLCRGCFVIEKEKLWKRQATI